VITLHARNGKQHTAESNLRVVTVRKENRRRTLIGRWIKAMNGKERIRKRK
jgi:hypothetical protein